MRPRPHPKWLSGNVGKDQRMSKRAERRTAKQWGGYRTIGSGNKGQKGDIHVGNLMIERKDTKARSIRVKLDDLEKLVVEAFEARKEPVFMFGFEQDTLHPTSWAAVPEDRLRELFEIERRYYELCNAEEAN